MENRKNYHEANNLGPIAENFIIVAIVFALVITVLDEFATVYEFSLGARNMILVASFATDLLFTIEFIVRVIVTSRHGAARHYMVHQRGWIDLLSSIPLMLLSSGPEVLLMVYPEIGHGAGLGFMSSIKVVKAVRVSRILRLLRLLKIMGKIHNTDSQMANRHIAVISTIATMAFIVVYSSMAFSGILGFHEIEQQNDAFYKNLATNIQNVSAQGKDQAEDARHERAREYLSQLLVNVDSKQSGIAQVYYKGKLLVSNLTASQLDTHFKYDEARPAAEKFRGDTHVHTIAHGDIIFHINTWAIQKEKARVNIMVFFGICAILLCFMFVYSRHFVQNVTDVVHVMQKGIDDPNFNLEVSIRKDFEHDEIFMLAKSYNEQVLPDKMKSKATGENTDTGGLSLDDFLK
ncbi:MAG: ion transporter [Turneriella sp.]